MLLFFLVYMEIYKFNYKDITCTYDIDHEEPNVKYRWL